MSPVRIQRKRTKGWRMPENAVYVGRPTRWGNPWAVGQFVGTTADGPVYTTPETCAELFRSYVLDPDEPLDVEELRGKDLACWCPLDQPCHADVLLKLANK